MAFLRIKYLFILAGLFMLVSACTKKSELVAPELTVDFSYTEVSPGKFAFTNNSKNAEGFFWDFGDGPFFDPDISPTHSYFKSGKYTVTLTAYNYNGEKTVKKEVVVTNTITPTKVFSKSIVYTKVDVKENDNDGTYPDIYFLLQEEVSLLYKLSVTVHDVNPAIVPFSILYTDPIDLTPLNTRFVMHFYEENTKASSQKLLSFYFRPSDYTAGVNKYPSALPFSGNGLEGFIVLDWR